MDGLTICCRGTDRSKCVHVLHNEYYLDVVANPTGGAHAEADMDDMLPEDWSSLENYDFSSPVILTWLIAGLVTCTLSHVYGACELPYMLVLLWGWRS